MTKTKTSIKKSKTSVNQLICPKCKKGTIIKGKTAYGCSNYVSGCDFRYLFNDIRLKANGQELTEELVYQIINTN